MTGEKLPPAPNGQAFLSLSIEVPVEAIISGWTRDEVAALLAGDREAREEFESQAASRHDLWSGFDLDSCDVEIDGKRLVS